MKWTTDPVTQVLAKLRDSAALQGVDFCRAYPNQMKPSRLLRPVVAVCLAEMDGTATQWVRRAGPVRSLCALICMRPRLPVPGHCNRCSPAFAARCWIGGCVRCRPARSRRTRTPAACTYEPP